MKLLMGLILIFTMGCTKSASQKTSQSHTHSKKLAKTRGFINVSIEEVKSDDETLTLQATVAPHRNMPESTMEWKLPEHINVLDGSLENNEDLIAGNNIVQKIVIDKKSLKENDKIFFFAYQMKDGERMGSSMNYVYKTADQDDHLQAQPLEKLKIKKKKLIQ